MSISLCPLCESSSANSCGEVEFSRVWDELTLQWGATFSPEVIERLTPSPTTALRRCGECGLEYFSPAVPGDAMFYDELSATSTGYYVGDRWEFGEIARMLKPEHRVLDIACGAGAFLARIQKLVSSAAGIDTNPEAVRRGQDAGLDVQLATLDAFAQDHPRAFDVVCALQVIEHLPKVLPFVWAALSCVKPGGCLIISVPNRSRRNKAEFEPLDCPPHHMSRWSVHQLEKLGELTARGVRQTACEVLAFPDAKSVVIAALAKRWPLPLLRENNVAARALARLFFSHQLYSVYRRAGLLDRWRMHGHSMLAVFEAAAADAAQSR